MRIAVLKEEAAGETRVAATPESVAKLIAAGATIAVQSGAGEGAAISDDAFREAGAEIAVAAKVALADADLVLKVRRPQTLDDYMKGAAIVALMDPYGHEDAVHAMAQAKLSAFALELLPRITRAQTMDVLSSQANLGGYRAVIEAAHVYGRAFPMMMTAAGTVPAARVFVMGAGVAGLQAIATARRLGAAVTATDVRPAAKEQVASLGAKFVAVEDEEFRQAEAAGGYAKEMSEDYRRRQAALVAEHIVKQDVVITTALIPGRPAPRLVTRDMIRSMRDGSVIVDLAVERGGNVEGSKPEKIVKADGVSIIGYANLPARLGATASALFARNVFAFVDPMIDKESGELRINLDDEIVKATLLTHGGAIVHPAFVQQSGTQEGEA
jgi:H+-translocating NAD(P) transhydrogenase subunit alpha